MPYRVDIPFAPPNALDLVVGLGALDVESLHQGLAALLPDSLPPQTLSTALGGVSMTISQATARDNGSVWLLSVRPVRIGSILITSVQATAAPGVLRLTDSAAFGTGHHPTTALCLEALEELLATEPVESILDVGTGSGILALAALRAGVKEALGLDMDADALIAAEHNAVLNNLNGRFELKLGGPAAVDRTWPLVVANVLAAPLIEMARVLVQRLSKGGRLVLSGIPTSLEHEVIHAYQHYGIRNIESRTRGGWVALIARAPW